MSTLPRYSIGTGDRFGHGGSAQLAALRKAREAGVEAAIVWNKSAREHRIIGSTPADQRAAAERAVRESGWDGAYFVDADHVGMKTVDAFAPHCDFFTIDVADFIGKPSPEEEVASFCARKKAILAAPCLPAGFNRSSLESAASKYLAAAREAGKVYRRILELKAGSPFVVEVSMDETAEPQGPGELLAVLAALAEEGVPASTIAPKFSGRFNKGVDYVGDPKAFLAEFEADLEALAWAAPAFGLPAGLKISVHSGSDKFSLYRGMGEILRRRGAGIHLKTAGTSWLEELVGLAESGGDGLALAKEIYRQAYSRFEELTAPYAEVIDVDPSRLPPPSRVETWEGEAFAAALRHQQQESRFDPGFRQLLHVGFKVAAELGERYITALERHRAAISRNVTENLWERHLRPLLFG